MSRGRKGWVDWSKPRSSAKARRLIKMVYKRTGSYDRTAKELGIHSGAHCRQILLGEAPDSKEVKAAVMKAEARARRAFGNTKPQTVIEDYRMAAKLINRATKHMTLATQALLNAQPFIVSVEKKEAKAKDVTDEKTTP